MGRSCNCCGEKPPCDEYIESNFDCWSSYQCLHYDENGNFDYIDDPLPSGIVDKHDFILITELSYSNKHNLVIWEDNQQKIIHTVDEDLGKNGTRYVTFTTSTSSAKEVLRLIRFCGNENYNGEIIEFSKSELTGKTSSLSVSRIGSNPPLTSRVVRLVIFSIEENKIIASSLFGTIPRIQCGWACFSKEVDDSYELMFGGLVKKEDVKRIYGIENPEIGVHYCGLGEDGELQTAQKLVSGQVSISSTINDIIFDTTSEVVVGGQYIDCPYRKGEVPSINRLQIQFNGDFSGTYPLIKVPYENKCFGDGWYIRIPPVSISAVYTTWWYYQYGLSGNRCCSEITNFEIPYAGVAKLHPHGIKLNSNELDGDIHITFTLYKAASYDITIPSSLPDSVCKNPLHQAAINSAPDVLSGSISSYRGDNPCGNNYLSGPLFPYNSNSFYGGTAYRAYGISINSSGQPSFSYSYPPFGKPGYPTEESFYSPSNILTTASTWNQCCDKDTPYGLDFKERLKLDINCSDSWTSSAYAGEGQPPIILNHSYSISAGVSVFYGIDIVKEQ